MNKQAAADKEKKLSTFRSSRSSSKDSRHTSQTNLAATALYHQVSCRADDNASQNLTFTTRASFANQVATAMENTAPGTAPVPTSDILPGSQASKVSASSSHVLSTISEKTSGEDAANTHTDAEAGTRTSSSCSMPDYLCHKLHLSPSHSQVPSQNVEPDRRDFLKPQVASSNVPDVVQPSPSSSRLVKEFCDSSTSTTTSESYQLSDLPPLPAKLATLNKPSSRALMASALRSRKARHSIDVRALPSYLARKRQSTFGQFLSVLSPTAPEESSSSDDPLFSEPVAPTLSLGERVAWVKSSGPEFGVVKWIGRMPQVTNDWTVGVEFDNAIGSGDGTVEGRRYFVAKENFAKFLPLSDLTKVDNYAGRPRSGTMLSRMSVQLKPGQLISIQRSPTTIVPHCYLNAPHHVGHDVHSPNNRHCQCHSCNHPCAHICKTRKPKGKKWTDEMAHMCHFSSKPHAQMCCGGEDLPSATQPIMEPGVSWKHSEVISSLRTVPTEPHSRRKSVTIHAQEAEMFKKSPRKQDTDLSPNYIRDNCSSALLERTGSDLSISSLPSSSSVAGVYIGRSVLTDESDIDSETERSLESNSKVGNKQGFRSLVACFLANSLRLSKSDKKEKPNRSHGGKRSKKSTRSEKNKIRSQRQHRLGLSSTDASYADIPSNTPNAQPLNSLSSDASRHSADPHVRPSALYSNRYVSCSNSKSFKSPQNSPCQMNEFGQQQHHIDGHISEEATNSSSSSFPKSVPCERPSTNVSSENAPSPRRRRAKGPAPKPPKIKTTQCSNSPLSANNVSTSCPSSLPQSPSNSSVVTSSSATSKKPITHTNSPVPLPPNLTRSLSEQKQLNMKIRINSMPSCRSEVNLQDINSSNKRNEMSSPPSENDENLVLLSDGVNLKMVPKQLNTNANKLLQEKPNDKDDSIYQTPLPIKTLILEGDIAPDLPVKTFDSVKMFGCKFNADTKKLEKRTDEHSSPSMIRSHSMPFSRFTCCLYHWKDYLATISKTGNLHKCDNVKELNKSIKNDSNLERSCDYKCCAPIQDYDSECGSDDETAFASDLMNALLSPKHSIRCKKNKDMSNSRLCKQNEFGDNLSQLCNNITSHEFIRALSDGSLTNTSTATVVEFIHDDENVGPNNSTNNLTNGKNNINTSPDKNPANSSDIQKPNEFLQPDNSTMQQRCLSDVFCQTNFSDLPDKPPRRYKYHKHSCRCRPPKHRSHGPNRHCRHHHSCSHHDCCPSAQNVACFSQDKPCRNVWLTSSTSDHSLSSLSSSTSTLSETSTMRTPSVLSNENSGLKPQLLYPSISPFGESLCQFNETGIAFFNDDSLAEIVSGRSPITTERLFKSAENSFPVVNEDSISEFGLFDQVNNKSATTELNSFENNPDMYHNSSLPFKINDKNFQSQLWSKEAQIKCLMSELETAIATGNHQRAAILAKELAIKRANCSFTGKCSNTKDNLPASSPIVAYLYIEDRNTHKGPIPFQVYPSMSVNMLKLKVEKDFGIASELQKWVLGKNIANNLNAALSTYGITHSGCPIFLYVLTQASKPTPSTNNLYKSGISEIPKANGSLSDDDNIYETLRPPSTTPYSDYNNIEQLNSSKVSTLTRYKSKDKVQDISPLNYQQNPLVALSANSTDNVHLYAEDDLYRNASSSAVSTSTEPILVNNPLNNQTNNMMKNYYYQEGEIHFGNELVFEGLSLVNELLPRVEEEDEDDLEDEEDEITAKDLNGIINPVNETSIENEDKISTYQQLIDLEDAKCVINIESFECPICFGQFKTGEGVVLRECLHTFCRECLKSTIQFNEEVQVKCPFRDNLYSCDCILQDREIKELAPIEIYEQYLKKSVSIAEKSLDKSFHCKTVDCPGWCVIDDNVNLFDCPVCRCQNCINCQAIHEGVNCKQYQEELEFNSATSENAKKTKDFLEDMLKREEALRCPQCKVIVMKKWGCDWVKCSMCTTEICWVTKGFRWGPQGKGDLSGGCRCMVNGIRCHPNCKYCH